MKIIIFNKQKGQTLIELLIVVALASAMLPTIFAGIMSSGEGRIQEKKRMEALPLLREAQDAARSFRDNSWMTFAVNGTYHPTLSANAWILSSGSETINGFVRQVVIADVYRDVNGAIAQSGTLDPSTKLVTTTVSWTASYPFSVVAQMYLTRHDNLGYMQTTAADFNAGNLIQTQVTTTADGEIKLGYNNRAKWCSPSFASATITLPDGPPVAVAATTSAVNTIPNDVFVVTAPYATSSVKLAYVKVSANTDIPIATQEGIFTMNQAQYSAGTFPANTGLDNNFVTTDVKYYKEASGKIYALLATDIPNKEVVVVQINDGNGNAFQDPTNKIYKYWTYFNTRMFAPVIPTLVNNNFETNNISPYSTVINSGSGSTVSTPVHGGTYAAKVTTTKTSASGVAGGGGCSGGKRIAISPNTIYNWSGYINVPTSGNTKFKDARIRVVYYSACTAGSVVSTNDSNTITTTGASWNQVTGTASSGTATYAEIQLLLDSSQNGTTSTAYFDDIAMNPDSSFNDQAPFNHGATALTIMGNTGYVDSGGYLYTFDLSNIDTKSQTNGLDQLGCRILLDGYECKPGTTASDLKYAAGETGTTWSDVGSPAHPNCSDGGNIELNADHQLSAVQVGNNKYVFIAVGAGTNPELDIADVSTPPNTASGSTCGRGSDTGWKVTGTLDLDDYSQSRPTSFGTEEAANSVYAKSDGTRAYLSSNGGIISGNNIPDSDQFYIIDTTTKSAPKFLSTWPSTQLTPPAPTPPHYANTASSGYYNGNATNIELYPRRALTVLNGGRAILVGQDGVPNDGIDPQEYQVLNIDTEATPTYCGGINYQPGFNDLTSVSEADGDNFVYMVANTNEKQLKIIQGGPDVGVYYDSGTFESKATDSGRLSQFNSFSANITKPANTDVKFQVAVAGAANANCLTQNYDYVGPDGTITSYFATTSAAIPFSSNATNYQNPGRCFRYKAYFSTTDTNTTPVINDFTVNYSP